LSQHPLTATLRVGGASIDDGPGSHLRLDRDGRWSSLQGDDGFFRRCLDGAVVRSVAGEPTEVRGAPVHALAQERARSYATALRAGREAVLRGAAHGESELLAVLDRAAAWNPGRLEGERERYSAAHPQPVQILPPDRYRDIVVQPATGCPHASCGFCAFFKDQRFAVLGVPEFDAHLQAVAALFGAGLPARDGLFLGSGSALSLPAGRLLGVLGACGEAFGELRRGVAAFHDPDHSARHSAADWQALFEAGLRQVVLGLETGDPELRRSLGKSGELGRLEEAVRGQKGAGLTVGITVLVGAGKQGEQGHREATLRLLDSLPLERADRVYLSPLEGSMEPARLLEEGERWLEAARQLSAAVAPYRMERFRYYA
jgi:radical SAM superfamily enzyme YgiQ (UPF0313 family)